MCVEIDEVGIERHYSNFSIRRTAEILNGLSLVQKLHGDYSGKAGCERAVLVVFLH